MKFRLTISGKIGLGFGILTVAYLLNAWFIYRALQKNQEYSKQVVSLYEPSVDNLRKLQNMVIESRLLLKNWAFIEKDPITPDKLKLMEIVELQMPYVLDKLVKISHNWGTSEQIIFSNVQALINDSLNVAYNRITKFLNKPEAYKDEDQFKEISQLLVVDGSIVNVSDQILSKVSILLNNHEDKVKTAQALIEKSYSNSKNLVYITSILLIFLALVISFLTIRSQVTPINYIKEILNSMGRGVLPAEKIKEGQDEIGEISKALNSLVKGLKDISNFSIEIGKGNFNSEFKPLSDDDILGNSLIKMREELSNAVVEEYKRKKEDDQRNWATQGIAKFSEILRQNNNSLNDLSYGIISNLVNYLNANQGGIYIVNDSTLDGLFLEMTGCYAYNRQKFIEKSFLPGEGLIGRCYLERGIIYLTEIPKDYIKITSGLGDDNPTCLLIVPLLYNDVVFGVMEIASFTKIEQHQIDFVEKIATSIASTISVVKINIQTTKLLEQSRQQAEEMASQEEEMRQNMEELRATQEESARKEAEMQKELKELKKRLGKYEI
jgi:methyl-accepting chemotaxis protein